jgi:exodeoxyribonuclease VII large subunit
MLHLDTLRSSLSHGFSKNMHRHDSRVAILSARLNKQNPCHRLYYNQKWLQEQARRLSTVMVLYLTKKRRSLEAAQAVVDAFNPRQVLHRGYSIVRDKKTMNLVSTCSQFSVGQDLEVLVTDGSADCTVTGVHEEQ